MEKFDKLYNEVIGTLQLTTKERGRYKDSLSASITRWRVKGILGEDELPGASDRIIWEWKMDMDKSMVVQMCESVAKRVFNYRRKVFGLIGTTPSSTYISHMVNEMMKEGMPIYYPDQDVIDKFFRGEPIE